MTLRRWTLMRFVAGSLLACLVAGCAEEGNDEYFQRTAPPGVDGPPQSYASGKAGQAAPGGGGAGAAPKGEAEPSGEAASEAPAPVPPEAPAPAEETKG